MEYMKSCNTCQKIKVNRHAQASSLRPAHIPGRPFLTVSLDLITGLPPSGEEGFTAIFSVVDKLMKFAIFLPTHNTMSQEKFADLFVECVANIYRLPERIIADRDKHWSTAFWKSVVSNYGSVMALSSSHHPQTDGQTEILNATIEQMLRAYIANDHASWPQWLSMLNYSYNSSVHLSTGYAPHFLLMGYKPHMSTVGFDPGGRPCYMSIHCEPKCGGIHWQIRIPSCSSSRCASASAGMLSHSLQQGQMSSGNFAKRRFGPN